MKKNSFLWITLVLLDCFQLNFRFILFIHTWEDMTAPILGSTLIISPAVIRDRSLNMDDNFSSALCIPTKSHL